MDLDSFTWFAVALVLGLAALAVTAHVLATDDGLTSLLARLRHPRRRPTTHLEGHDHARERN